MKLVLAVAALCAAFAQEAPKSPARPEIRGLVLEPGTNQPVVDAEISLYFLGEERPRIRVGLGMLTAASITRTDFAGAFSFRLDKLGYYAVAAKKEGYSSPSTGGSSQDVTLTADSPAKEARLALSRPGRLTGRVIDEETRKPIANVRVGALRPMRLAGRMVFGSPGFSNAVTGPDGTFIASNLSPGDYVVEISRQTSGKDRILTKFSEEDLKTVDQDFEHTYWPGGHGEEAAIPVTVGGSATVDIGQLPVKKTSYYRLSVRMPSSTCGPEDTMQLYETPPGGSGGMWTISQEARCQDMLVTGFQPGSYRLILAVNKRSRENREMASIPFVISDKNVEITAPLERGVAIDAAFATADGARPPDFSTLSVALYPLEMLPFADLASPVKADAKGSVRFTGVPMGKHRVMVQGIGAGNYVKEIRYNGIPIAARTLQLDRSAMAHALTVVIDDKPATITGAITKDDKPASRAYVILAKWPLPGDEPFLPTAAATADDNGKFQAAGLAPGEYRAVALASREQYDGRAPNAMERALAAAKKTEAGPRGFVNVTLEVTDLRQVQ